MVTGRPTSYTPELAEKICKTLGAQLRGIDHLYATLDWFPAPDSIYEWIKKHKEFSEMYSRARQSQAEIGAIAQYENALMPLQYLHTDDKGQKKVDSGIVNTYKMIGDALRWQAERVLPHKYGTKVIVEDTTPKSPAVIFQMSEKQKKKPTDAK